MKGRSILIDKGAAALMVDGRLDDLVYDPPHNLAPGAILRGKISRVVKGAAFVDLPGGQGYLRQGNAKEGRTVLVQVSTVAEPGKAVPVTTRLVFKGSLVIVTPGAKGINLSRQIKGDGDRDRLMSAVTTDKARGSDHGIVVRTAAVFAHDAAIAAEVDRLIDAADALLGAKTGGAEVLRPAPDAETYAMREWAVGDLDRADNTPGSFERGGAAEAIAALKSPEVPLGEGSMIIEATRALVAVDVNTGSDTSPAAALKANLAVARDLPRQLRLRGLGGKIAVDFAPMPKSARRGVEDALKKAFRADAIETSLAGWTTLGFFELQRKRERWPLRELL